MKDLYAAFDAMWSDIQKRHRRQIDIDVQNMYFQIYFEDRSHIDLPRILRDHFTTEEMLLALRNGKNMKRICNFMCVSKKGTRLLLKMKWGGVGLGRRESGILDTSKISGSGQTNRHGIGYDKWLENRVQERPSGEPRRAGDPFLHRRRVANLRRGPGIQHVPGLQFPSVRRVSRRRSISHMHSSFRSRA